MAIDSKNLLVWVKAMSRGQALPLDASEVYESMTDAETYASSAIAYAGQTIKVKMDDNKYHTYILQPGTSGYVLEEVIGSGSGDGSGVIVDSDMSSTSTNPVQNKVIYEALSSKANLVHDHNDNYYVKTEVDEKFKNMVGETSVANQIAPILTELAKKADKEHTHDNIQLYDTVTGSESIDINAAIPQCPIEVTLSSEVYTDLSQITVVLTSDSETQNATSNSDGVVAGLNSESAFTLSLQSDMADFDPSQVTISCTYPLDVSRALHDYVLYVDLEGGEDSDGIDDTIIVDDTLSISGAAADAKATGDRFRTIDERLNEALVGMRSASYPIVETTETTLEPDKYYVFGTVDSLVVTLQDIDDGYTHEHCFEFTTADEFYGMRITPEPKWVDEPSIESNKTYQVSILRGIGVIAGA